MLFGTFTCLRDAKNDNLKHGFTAPNVLHPSVSMQDNDDDASGGLAEEASHVLPRTNKRAILEESSDEDD